MKNRVIILIFVASIQSSFANRAGLGGGSCNYNSVEDAVAASSPNDTVYLPKGEEIEVRATLRIPHNLTVRTGSDVCTADINIDANQRAILTRATSQPGRVFSVFNSSRLAIIDLDVQSGLAEGRRGGIVKASSDTTLIVRNSILGDGRAARGGCIYAEDSNVKIINSVVSGCAADSGGGVYLDGGELQLGRRAVIGNNEAALRGGGIFVAGGATLKLSGEMSSNRAGVEGGGMYLAAKFGRVSRHFRKGFAASAAPQFPSVVIENSALVLGNSAEHGGGLFIAPLIGTAGSTTTVHIKDDVRFRKNRARQNGGGVYSSAGHRVLIEGDAQFENHTAGQYGGALYLRGTSLVVNGNVDFHVGTAGERGGAVSAFDSRLRFTGRVSFDSFNAESGGAMYIYNSPLTAAGNFEIKDCGAVLNGGAIYSDISPITMTGEFQRSIRFVENKATTYSGGAIYAAGNDVDLINAYFLGNHSDGPVVKLLPHASAAYERPKLRLINSHLENNSTSYGGAISSSSLEMDVDFGSCGASVGQYCSSVVGTSCSGSNCTAAVLVSTNTDPFNLRPNVVSINRTLFRGNQVVGGGWQQASIAKFTAFADNPVKISQCVFEDNGAKGPGAMFFLNPSNLEIDSSTFINNGTVVEGLRTEFHVSRSVFGAQKAPIFANETLPDGLITLIPQRIDIDGCNVFHPDHLTVDHMSSFRNVLDDPQLDADGKPTADSNWQGTCIAPAGQLFAPTVDIVGKPRGEEKRNPGAFALEQ